MISFAPDVRELIAAHASELPTEEVCGFVVLNHKDGKPAIIRARNTLRDEERKFAFSMEPGAEVAAREEGDVVAVYHSHPNQSPEPTEEDKYSSEELELPFIIYSTWSQEWRLYEPSGYALAYENRPYLYGVIDCFTVWRDWYAGELKINLPDIYRAPGFWTKGIRLWEEHLPANGFSPVKGEKQRGDSILFRLTSTREPNPEGIMNHCAVYLGDGMMLHHPYHGASKIVPYVDRMGYYAKHLAGFYRHISQQQ